MCPRASSGPSGRTRPVRRRLVVVVDRQRCRAGLRRLPVSPLGRLARGRADSPGWVPARARRLGVRWRCQRRRSADRRPPSGVCSSISVARPRRLRTPGGDGGGSAASSSGGSRFVGLVGRMTHAAPRGMDVGDQNCLGTSRENRVPVRGSCGLSFRPAIGVGSAGLVRRAAARSGGDGGGPAGSSGRRAEGDVAEPSTPINWSRLDQTSRLPRGRRPSAGRSSARPRWRGRGRPGSSTRPCSSRPRWRSGTRPTADTHQPEDQPAQRGPDGLRDTEPDGRTERRVASGRAARPPGHHDHSQPDRRVEPGVPALASACTGRRARFVRNWAKGPGPPRGLPLRGLGPLRSRHTIFDFTHGTCLAFWG